MSSSLIRDLILYFAGLLAGGALLQASHFAWARDEFSWIELAAWSAGGLVSLAASFAPGVVAVNSASDSARNRWTLGIIMALPLPFFVLAGSNTWDSAIQVTLASLIAWALFSLVMYGYVSWTCSLAKRSM